MGNSKVKASLLVSRAQLWGLSITRRELALTEPWAEGESSLGSSPPGIMPYTQEQYVTLKGGI